MKTHKTNTLITLLVAFVGINGAFSVLFGAWLAHAGQVLPADDISRLTYALQYQFLHTIALLIVTLWYEKKPVMWLKLSAIGFALGIVLFSGSLYLKTFLDITQFSALSPLGGITLALAWLSITVHSVNIFSKK